MKTRPIGRVFLCLHNPTIVDTQSSILYIEDMKEIVRYSKCFVCGDENPFGLAAKFFYDGEKAITTVVADEKWEGYHGIYHGGVLSSLLDEVMIKSILAEDKIAVTAEMTIRFNRPVHVGDELRLSGWVVRSKGRVHFTEGSALGVDGTIYATASGKYIEARSELKDQLVKSID